ncbi:MAG TPA: Fe-S cluster assembly protein SufD [Vicinamibacterales bacterium]|nr:Fe-S cluster assembly protein SufD [Vicinamibacterales bacterium]
MEAVVQAIPAWVKERREHAAKRFAEVGFPTVRNEDWRFTNVAPVADAKFPLARGVFKQAAALVNAVNVPGAVRLTICNGEFVPALSDLSTLPKGLKIAGLRDGARDNADGLEQHLARTFEITAHPFAALNTSHLDDGVAIFVAKGAAIETPIHIVTLTGSDTGAVASHPRVLVVAGPNSQARIAQSFIGVEGAPYFTNSVAEIVVGEGAMVDYYTDQRESESAFHVANLQARVSANGVFSSHAFLTGARIMRHDIGVALKGEGADCTMNGVYLADGDRLMDTHSALDHAMPHCTSHELYKGILAGKARAVFNGRIIVRIDAQKTDAKQTNRALLLSDEATINSNPQLEIFADDVKCTHGAAVGQLDEEAMFYLMARGLTRLEARDMMLHAFAGEVLDGLKIPALREQIENNFFAALARDVQLKS